MCGRYGLLTSATLFFVLFLIKAAVFRHQQCHGDSIDGYISIPEVYLVVSYDSLCYPFIDDPISNHKICQEHDMQEPSALSLTT